MRILIGSVCVAALLLTSTASAESPKAKSLIERLAREIDANAKASEKVKAFARTTLLPQCANPVFVRAAAAQNAKETTLEKIKQLDAQWVAAEDELPIQAELMSNACAQEIKKFANASPAISETFVMDNQGVNVGQNALTSDYWQGDEPKWTNAYNDGKGGVDVSANALDKSTNQVLQRVSLPLIDAEGRVIGAVSFGLMVDRL
jgi:hypothetical protein